ncbi:MAG: polysaccharide deacetylase family protein, partial [Desulfobacteraceae bacterium]|nr:polysaccharide deacetylase family protein [Desulfobacteraceae bacterium]
DGPDPHTTPYLLTLLARYKVPAAFFVPGCNARAHPELIEKILQAGHSIGNHTYSHDVLVMLKSGRKLAREIDAAQEVLKTTGVIPLAFRPPAGAINPKLGPILKKREMICVHFSRRGLDMGNRRIRGLSGKILKKISPGDIVLLHDTRPVSGDFQVEAWLEEIEKILAGITKKGLEIVPLDQLIDRPVMLPPTREQTGELPGN